MYVVGSLALPGLRRPAQVFLNLFIDNGFLLVVAVGMTFVILTGGIDLSVGSVVALTTHALGRAGPGARLAAARWCIPLVLLVGAALGFAMGCVIHFFEIQPFIVTLAGMFLARGLCYVISIDVDPDHRPARAPRSPQDSDRASVASCPDLVERGHRRSWWSRSAATCCTTRRLGRNVYAIGGNEQSALLMGLPVARTKIAVYTISGFCSALGGILLSFYILSGYGAARASAWSSTRSPRSSSAARC